MSPDPSVHEDQLAEIERNRRKHPSLAPHRRGCFGRLLVLIVMALLALGAWILWRSHTQGTSPSVEAGKLAQEVTDEGRRLSGRAPEDIVASLREKIEALKKSWSNHDQEIDDLHKRADALRTTLAEHKQQATDLLRTQYDDLRQRAEALAQSAKAQGEKVPAELDDLLRTLRSLTGHPTAETLAPAAQQSARSQSQATPAPTPKPMEKKP